MKRRHGIVYIGIPLAIAFLHFVAVMLLPEPAREWFASESGPVEWGTAVLFLAASIIAALHYRNHWDRLPVVYRPLFLLFAMGALFVALEEMSYGQHILGFESPDWFERHNKQQEANLHNLMGNKPSDTLRTAANIGFPLLCIAVPLLVRRRWTQPNDREWTWQLLPKLELVPTIMLACVVALPKRLPALFGEVDPMKLGELKELYWALAACMYICLIYRRHSGSQSEETAVVTIPFSATTEARQRRRAA